VIKNHTQHQQDGITRQSGIVGMKGFAHKREGINELLYSTSQTFECQHQNKFPWIKNHTISNLCMLLFGQLWH